MKVTASITLSGGATTNTIRSSVKGNISSRLDTLTTAFVLDFSSLIDSPPLPMMLPEITICYIIINIEIINIERLLMCVKLYC